MENSSYITIKNEASYTFTVERSKFIGYAKPVQTEAQAEEYINSIKKKHWDAKHNVYAYVLKNGKSRCSDDGEPSGTAGMPVLDVLLKEEICDAVVVVTRYFGGILLGTGGLVRAYSKSAKGAVDSAQKAKMVKCRVMHSNVAYNQYDKFVRFLNDSGCVAEKTEFNEDVLVSYYIEEEKTEKFIKQLGDSFSGNIVAILSDTLYKVCN